MKRINQLPIIPDMFERKFLWINAELFPLWMTDGEFSTASNYYFMEINLGL